MPDKPKGRPSQVRMHPRLDEINRDLVLRNGSQKTIAERYGLHPDAVTRHWQGHVRDNEELKRQILLDAKIDEHQRQAAALNGERVEIDTGLRKVVSEIEAILARAKGNEDDMLALGSLREMRATLLALAKIHGQLSQELTVRHVSISEDPRFHVLRAIILDVLERHPAAKADFLAAMQTGLLADAG